ncbi:hypothetical protein ACTFIZ_004001 [Dictyostelium cf. discoideum]
MKLLDSRGNEYGKHYSFLTNWFQLISLTITTTADTNGIYIFTHLEPSNYCVSLIVSKKFYPTPLIPIFNRDSYNCILNSVVSFALNHNCYLKSIIGDCKPSDGIAKLLLLVETLLTGIQVINTPNGT